MCGRKLRVFQSFTLSYVFHIIQFSGFSVIYPCVASAAKHSWWVPILSLVTDPSDTVTSNSFGVSVGCVMPDIVKCSCDVILNLVTLEKNTYQNIKQRFQSKRIDIAFTLYLLSSDLWNLTFNLPKMFYFKVPLLMHSGYVA